MKEIFSNDKEMHSMILEVPEFVNTKRNDCILSKKYTTKEEGFDMKKLNKKLNNVIDAMWALVGISMVIWILADAFFGHIPSTIVTIITVVLGVILYIRKLQLEKKILKLRIKARH